MGDALQAPCNYKYVLHDCIVVTTVNVCTNLAI